MSGLSRSLDALGKFGEAIENVLLLLLLLGMIGLSAAQILLRNFFDIGFFWSDEVLRMLVLWIALTGAVAASRSDKHIAINLLDNFLSPRVLPVARLVTHAFSVGICGLLTWFSLQFALTTREYGDVVLSDTPAWLLQLVLPLGFGLMTYRYLLYCFKDIMALFGRRAAEPGL